MYTADELEIRCALAGSPRAEQLIACLEGEIAKRDARIAELEARIVWLECEAQVNAAPVPEAKAQGVVLTDEELCSIRNQVACNEVRRDDDSRTICVKHGRAIETAVLARLNAAPVQQVSVPDGWKLVPVELTREMAKAVGDLAERKWCYCLTAANVCEIFSTVLAAAPAAPAADAGMVLEQAMYALIGIGYHENSGLVHELRQSLAAHRAQGVV